MAEQLELFGTDPQERRCSCGAELRSSIEDFRRLCDMCILRAGRTWDEDPEAKRRHLMQWLARKGQTK